MIPLTGTITSKMINKELGKLENDYFNLNDADVRKLAEKSTGIIKFSDLRGKSAGRKIESFEVKVFYNNGSSRSRIGIKEIELFDIHEKNITKELMEISGGVYHSKKSNTVRGDINTTVDKDIKSEFYGFNNEGGDAQLGLAVYGKLKKGILKKVKRIKVYWGNFQYSDGHDGSEAQVIINGKREYYFYHHRGGSPQPPTTDIIFND